MKIKLTLKKHSFVANNWYLNLLVLHNHLSQSLIIYIPRCLTTTWITGYWNILLVIITWYLQLWNLGAKLLLQKLFTKKEYNGININDFIRDLVDIGLYSAVIDAKSTSDAWRDSSNAFNTVVNKHVKIKEIRVKDRSNPWMTNEILALIYKRDYTHRMAVRLTLLTKWMNLKNWEIWSSQQFETRNDPIIRKQSQPINPVTFGKQ